MPNRSDGAAAHSATVIRCEPRMNSLFAATGDRQNRGKSHDPPLRSHVAPLLAPVGPSGTSIVT